MEEYKNGGLDAVRDLYWNKNKQLPYEIRYNKDINFGGNVLLRFAHQEGYIETSKGIRLSFEECHRWFQRSACHSNCLRLRPTSLQRLASHHWQSQEVGLGY